MKDTTTVRTTCPRDCYDACGIVVKLAADGTINVVGDPEHDVSRGALCGKCSIGYNGVWRDPGVRLTRPLKRVGPKGTGRFQPIGWDEALGDIAIRLNAIRGRDGAAILQTHYTGTCSLIAGSFPLRFYNRIGATEVDPDTVCNKAGHVALQLTYGESTRGFDPRTIDGTNCVMIWERQSIHLGAARASILALRDASPQDRHRSHSPRDGGSGGHAFAALPGDRRRARFRHAARHIGGRPHRSGLPRHAFQGLGGDRRPIGRMHSGMGGSHHRRTGSLD